MKAGPWCKHKWGKKYVCSKQDGCLNMSSCVLLQNENADLLIDKNPHVLSPSHLLLSFASLIKVRFN